jgi:hypothetical protein
MGGAILSGRPNDASTILPEVGHEVVELCIHREVSYGYDLCAQGYMFICGYRHWSKAICLIWL